MAWVKIDDQFADHPKIIAVGPLAAWLYVCGLTYCGRYLTDGFIPGGQVRKLADVDNPSELVAKLVAIGLWNEQEDGYIVHDYLEYNPTAEEVKATRQARTEAGRRGGIASGKSRREANTKANASAKTKQKRTPSPSPSHVSTKDTVRDFYDELAQSWKNYYPKKRKYGYATVREKIAARYKHKHFREHWQEAIRMSCNVKKLRTEGWFSFEYFIRNNTNYLKLLDGGFTFKDNPDGKQAPQSPVAPVRDAKGM